jgi:hypothetical protein
MMWCFSQRALRKQRVRTMKKCRSVAASPYTVQSNREAAKRIGAADEPAGGASADTWSQRISMLAAGGPWS